MDFGAANVSVPSSTPNFMLLSHILFVRIRKTGLLVLVTTRTTGG